MLDAIGHVVEKNAVRETEKNGKRSKVMDVTLEDLEMNIANVELTQVVRQVSGPVVLSVADDLLQTPRMTIEDLIESTEKCVGYVLAVACEIDTDSSWFYQACSRCASRINYIGGQLYCEKCKMPRTAIPRFKVHLQVIDDTGSITFVMFDRIVSQVLGRTTQDLLDAMNNEEASNAYPQELDTFVDKQILFKVEVTDANLYRNWRGYTVKKLSFDDDIINRFTALHGINSSDVCDGADYTRKTTGKKGFNVDGVRSSTTEGSFPPTVELVGADISQVSPLKQATSTTPTSKISGKKADNVAIIDASPPKVPSPCTRSITRSMVSTEIDHVSPTKQAGKRCANVDQGEIAATKDTKMPCVKMEPLE
ncbi:replication protein A 70 kDa DNA-binding subunit B [Trifolium repens]|nr:replication protein A 70 kDa DNA-binding subunit B [Trifolium repens]